MGIKDALRKMNENGRAINEWKRAHPDAPAANKAGEAFGVSFDPNGLTVRGQGRAPLAGLSARVESVGELRSRVTATRVLATGVFALALKKKTDDRQVFLTIEGEGVSFLVEAAGTPEAQHAARTVAAFVNRYGSAG